MTRKDKELLLKDLCARLPYNTVISYNFGMDDTTRVMGIGSLHDFMFCNADVKPYLRPMSSMSEEEYDQLYIDSRIKDDSIDILDALANDMDAIDWLNAHHFDYRGLIEKGLALEAPERMYNIKEK